MMVTTVPLVCETGWRYYLLLLYRTGLYSFGSGYWLWYKYAVWICLWILKFENLFMRHLWGNSNARRECSRLGRNEANV